MEKRESDNDRPSSPSHQDSFPVVIKTNSGQTLSININTQSTVSDLKTLINKRQRIPPDVQRLVFAGKELTQPSSLLSEYQIRKESIIQLVVRRIPTPKSQTPTSLAIPIPTPPTITLDPTVQRPESLSLLSFLFLVISNRIWETLQRCNKFFSQIFKQHLEPFWELHGEFWMSKIADTFNDVFKMLVSGESSDDKGSFPDSWASLTEMAGTQAQNCKTIWETLIVPIFSGSNLTMRDRLKKLRRVGTKWLCFGGQALRRRSSAFVSTLQFAQTRVESARILLSVAVQSRLNVDFEACRNSCDERLSEWQLDGGDRLKLLKDIARFAIFRTVFVCDSIVFLYRDVLRLYVERIKPVVMEKYDSALIHLASACDRVVPVIVGWAEVAQQHLHPIWKRIVNSASYFVESFDQLGIESRLREQVSGWSKIAAKYNPLSFADVVVRQIVFFIVGCADGLQFWIADRRGPLTTLFEKCRDVVSSMATTATVYLCAFSEQIYSAAWVYIRGLGRSAAESLSEIAARHCTAALQSIQDAWTPRFDRVAEWCRPQWRAAEEYYEVYFASLVCLAYECYEVLQKCLSFIWLHRREPRRIILEWNMTKLESGDFVMGVRGVQQSIANQTDFPVFQIAQPEENDRQVTIPLLGSTPSSLIWLENKSHNRRCNVSLSLDSIKIGKYRLNPQSHCMIPIETHLKDLVQQMRNERSESSFDSDAKTESCNDLPSQCFGLNDGQPSVFLSAIFDAERLNGDDCDEYDMVDSSFYLRHDLMDISASDSSRRTGSESDLTPSPREVNMTDDVCGVVNKQAAMMDVNLLQRKVVSCHLIW